METSEGGSQFEKIMVCGDLHIPFVDKRLLRLFFSFLDDFKPDRLIIDGDLVDFWEISKFSKVPRWGKHLRDEIDEVKDLLKEFRQHLPKAQIELIEGNHEFRLRSYLMRQAPELYELEGMSLEEQLHLLELGINWHPVKSGASHFIDNYIKVGKLYVGHFNSVSQHAGYTAKNIVDKKGISILQGHTHRHGVNVRRFADGRQVIGVENFCMCSLTPDYMADPNWQSGWSVVYHKKSSGRFHIYPLHVINYGVIWNGRFYDEEKR